MTIQNRLAKMATLLIFLMPLVTVADDNKSVDPFAEAKKEPKDDDIPAVKLDDIVAGKYAKIKKKATDKKKKLTPKIAKKQPSSRKIKKKIAAVTAKKIPPKAPKVAQKKEPEPEIDLMKAYSALMETSTKKKPVKKEIAKAVAVPPKPKPNSAVSSNGTTLGWLYLGKFSQGEWDKKDNHVLGLKGLLPKANHYYSIRVSSNIRKGKPSKGKMPGVIKVLSTGSKIRVLTVHNSGRSGHYWAKITW